MKTASSEICGSTSPSADTMDDEYVDLEVGGTVETITERNCRSENRGSSQDRNSCARRARQARYIPPYVPGELWPDQPSGDGDAVVLVTQVEPGFRLREAIAHAVKRPSRRMHILDEDGRILLRDVPMEGVGP